MNYFIFGKIGVGKTFVGRVLARDFGLPHYDADADLSPAIQAAVRAQQPFTASMRAEVGQAVRSRIERMSAAHPRFCISQALFRNEQRNRLREAFPTLVWIRIDASTRHIETRLKQRRDGIADLLFAQSNNHRFEPPNFDHHVIVNEADAESIAQQFENILKVSRLEALRSGR